MPGIKIKDILKIVKAGTGVGKVFVPGPAGRVLDAVNKSIADPEDPQNTGAVQTVAAMDDEQNQAILALHARLEKVERQLGLK